MNSRISQLAAAVSTNVSKVSTYLEDNDLPMPSFEADGPVDLNIRSEDVQHSREAALEAMMELFDLLRGPVACMLPDWNVSSLQIIHRYDIARKVPLEGSISISDLAEQCSLQVDDLKRVIRYAITWHRLFAEPQKGFIAHSAGSKALATDEILRAGLGEKFDEFCPAFARTADALEKFKDSEPNHTGFALAHNTDETMFGYLGQHPDKADQFAKSMRAFCREEVGWSVDFTVDSYNWGTIPDTLVDMGGSDGHISVAIAKAHPHLSFIIQDLPHVSELDTCHDAKALVKAGRMQFMSHDFFTVQPVVASAYLFRGIFHNWPDHYVVRILRNLVPALRPGSRVILNETLSPEPGSRSSLSLQRRDCYMDMLLMALNNARQRTLEEWQQIFKTADPRFGTVKVFAKPKAALSILEVFWES